VTILLPSSSRGRFTLVPALMAALIVFAPVVVGQSPPREVIERGHQQFQQSCGFCHGVDATGARGPDLVRSPLVAHDANGNLIGEIIRSGRPDKGMPALPLTSAQIADIVAYLHARAREALDSGRVPGNYPLSRLLTGNVQAGKTYFNGAGGCTPCHSSAGDLAHVASRYPPLELEARMLAPSPRPSTVIVTLPGGEQVKGTLVHVDEFTIGLRDGSGWYRAFSRENAKVDIQDPLAAHHELLNRLSQDDLHNLFAYLVTLK
jgi:cytochrome c oxidase cbb3-type subunit III